MKQDSVPLPNPNLTDKVLRLFGYQPRLPEPVWRGLFRVAAAVVPPTVIAAAFGYMIGSASNGGVVILPFPIFLH